jgi:hypothetical protein
MVKQFNNFFNGLKNVKLFLFLNKNRIKGKRRILARRFSFGVFPSISFPVP